MKQCGNNFSVKKSPAVWRKYILFPELGEYSAAELHPLQRLFRDLHVLVDGVHAGFDLLELFCARTDAFISWFL